MAEKEQGRQEREPGQQPEPTTERGQEELSDEQLDQAAGGSWSWGETNSGTM